MKIVGYGDRFSVQPGETVRFMVSCQVSAYRAEIVRLIHGDDNPKGPGVKFQPVAATANGLYPGRVQALHRGSFLVVPDPSALDFANGFTVQAWIRPTTPDKDEAGDPDPLVRIGTGGLRPVPRWGPGGEPVDRRRKRHGGEVTDGHAAHAVAMVFCSGHLGSGDRPCAALARAPHLMAAGPVGSRGGRRRQEGRTLLPAPSHS